MRKESQALSWRLLLLLICLNCWISPWQTQAQPTIVSVVPANLATGVPTNSTVVFTFSAAMDTNFTEATFYDLAFAQIPTIPAWNSGHTVLTCTPDPSWPPTSTITWLVNGEDADGFPLGGIPVGQFTTGTGGSSGGGGSGTNTITTFSFGKIHLYDQTSSAAPTLDPTTPYIFTALNVLSSNRTATNVSLTLPTSAVSNLVRNPFQQEMFTLSSFNTNLTTFDNTFPSGNYTFNVQAVNSNQLVTVNLPSTMLQPAAPHLTNYNAAQAVNPSQPFTLAWDPFPGGTSTDFVYVAIGTAFTSTNVGAPGALPGTATTLTIPAGTLQPNSNYFSSISFYRMIATNSSTNYITFVHRYTQTDFTLTTTGAAVPGPLVLTNATRTPANFSFDVLCSTGQQVTVQYRTNLGTAPWQTLLTTNSPGNRFRAVAPQAATNRVLFFRARNGP